MKVSKISRMLRTDQIAQGFGLEQDDHVIYATLDDKPINMAFGRHTPAPTIQADVDAYIAGDVKKENGHHEEYYERVEK